MIKFIEKYLERKIKETLLKELKSSSIKMDYEKYLDNEIFKGESKLNFWNIIKRHPTSEIKFSYSGRYANGIKEEYSISFTDLKDFENFLRNSSYEDLQYDEDLLGIYECGLSYRYEFKGKERGGYEFLLGALDDKIYEKKVLKEILDNILEFFDKNPHIFI